MQRLFAVRGVPGTGWLVVAGLPREETLRSYEASRDRTLAAILALLAWAAWLVTARCCA